MPLESDLKMWSEFERPRMTLGFYTPLGPIQVSVAHRFQSRECFPFTSVPEKSQRKGGPSNLVSRWPAEFVLCVLRIMPRGGELTLAEVLLVVGPRVSLFL